MLNTQNIFPFENEKEEQLFNKISKELRCTVCQNQSIFDSMAPIAIDLRKEVYRQVKSGSNEQEIVQFVVNHYGQDISYNPPMQVSTSFLWLGPVLMFILGLLVLKHYISINTSNRKS